MMATTRLISFSSTLTFFSSFSMPTLGIMSSRRARADPSLRICRNWSRKSSSVNSFSMSLRCISTACFWSMSSLGLFDEREDVAHAEDAVGGAVGMERLERVELLAHAHELQRLAGDVADGERRAAARIAIHLGEDDAGDAQPLVELVGRFDGVLAGHGVGHEEDLDRVELLFELLQLGHEIVVDMQAAGGIHQQHVAPGVDGFLAARRARQIERQRSLPARLRRWAGRLSRAMTLSCSRAAGR